MTVDPIITGLACVATLYGMSAMIGVRRAKEDRDYWRKRCLEAEDAAAATPAPQQRDAAGRFVRMPHAARDKAIAMRRAMGLPEWRA